MKSLNIEVAGLRAQIYEEKPLSSTRLDSRFRDFVSHGKPYFVVNCRDLSRLVIREKDLVPLRGGLDVQILKHDNKLQVIINSGKEIELGIIDLTEKKCQFNNYTDTLWSILFPPFLRACFLLFLVKSKGLMLHACGIALDGKGYLFIGPSGSGKTTVASLSPSPSVLSDEFICVRKNKKFYSIYGTPWRGTGNGPVKLEKIFFLIKARENSFQRLPPPAALRETLPNILYSFIDQEIMGWVLDTTTDMICQVPSYLMRFSLNCPIWELILNLDGGRK